MNRQGADGMTNRAGEDNKDDFTEYARNIQVSNATPVDSTAPTVKKWMPTGK